MHTFTMTSWMSGPHILLVRSSRRIIGASSAIWCWITFTMVLCAHSHSPGTATHHPQCPSVCTCTYRGTGVVAAVHVNCTQAYLSNLPLGLNHRVELVDLSHNPLGVITDDYFTPHAYLHTIHMSYCSIRIITKGAFNDLHKLRELSLRGNILSELSSDTLSHLSALVDLDLSRNQLSDLGNLLLHKPELKKLRLQHNQLTSLPKGNPDTLQKLEGLNLNFNPLKKLQPVSFFKTLRSLSSLHLASTQLSNLQVDVFVNLQRLKVLNLADNFLHEISASCLQPMQGSIVTLDMSGNPLNCSSCVNLGLRHLLEQLPLVTWTPATAATCQYPEELQGNVFHLLPPTDFTCDEEVFLSIANDSSNYRTTREKKNKESPYKSKFGPLEYNPLMGWFTAATLSGMLVLFLVCLALDKAKRQFFKWHRRRRARRKKGSYRSGSLRQSGKGSHNSIDVMDSISMVAMNNPFHRGSFNTSFNSSFDTDKDSSQGKAKSNLSLGSPPLTNDNRAASLRLKFKERRVRPDSLSLGTTSQHKTYRFPAVPIDTLTNSLEQAETNL